MEREVREEFVVPDQLDPVVGWRSWQVAIHNGWPCLQACTRHILWLPGQRMEAVCEIGFGDASEFTRCDKNLCPCTSCTCGLYATWQPDHILAAKVYGQINAWGRVVKHERGFRAQYAYPKILFAPAELIAPLHAYGVPVEEGLTIERCDEQWMNKWAKIAIPATTYQWTATKKKQDAHLAFLLEQQRQRQRKRTQRRYEPPF